MNHLKRQLGDNQLARLGAHEPIADAAVDAVDQRASNCLGGCMVIPRHVAGVDHHALTSPSVVHCQFFELFGARRSTASKLASLRNCSAAHELLLRDKKILLLEGR
ncbi:hypothetical protein TNCV_4915981 [Trichonephila clavipes]|nr:hypothetical protein TNCV_4915981 [Trichonephila clavipes]